MNVIRRVCAASFLILLLGAFSGCSAPAPAEKIDPSAVVSAPEATRRQKVEAIESMAADLREGRVDPVAGREPLKTIAWRRGARNDLRLAAIKALLEDDPVDTAHMLGLMLPTETDWDVIRKIGDLAVENHWTELAPALVRSWSRPVATPTDADRPERAALVGLFPGESIEAVVYRVFATPGQDDLFSDRARTQAWGLLQRIDKDGSRTRALLENDASPDSGDALLADLHASARELRVVPRTAEQLDWLRSMRTTENQSFWRSTAKAVSTLTDEQRDGLALRHVAAVVWASAHEPSWLAASRTELLSQAKSQLDSVRKHQRTDGYVDFTGDQRETFATWESRLVWGDALDLLVAIRAIVDPGVAERLFDQATKDQADTTTEYGGAIDALADGFRATLYPPRPTQRVSDRRFVASADLLRASATSLFHYHFHAQKWRNEAFAGPGRGDLDYANRFGRACIVFTLVSKNTIDADYYQPGGARLDLGEISRQSSSENP